MCAYDIDKVAFWSIYLCEIRLAIKYIRHLQLLLASPPGSTVDYEATNFSLDPLPSWRSFGFSAPSTSKELTYDLPLGVFMPNSGSAETAIPEFSQSFNHSGANFCLYDDAVTLNWSQSNESSLAAFST